MVNVKKRKDCEHILVQKQNLGQHIYDDYKLAKQSGVLMSNSTNIHFKFLDIFTMTLEVYFYIYLVKFIIWQYDSSHETKIYNNYYFLNK